MSQLNVCRVAAGLDATLDTDAAKCLSKRTASLILISFDHHVACRVVCPGFNMPLTHTVR